jgi:hypothetical protein
MLGFDQRDALAMSVAAWLELFDRIGPDAVVLDYAPVAQLAALLRGVRAMQISNGFDAPPAGCPVFDLGVRGPYLERMNAQRIARLSESIDYVAQQHGRNGISLESVLGYPTLALDCVAETDPYGGREGAMYLGPLISASQAHGIPRWPEGPTQAPRVFVYLRRVSEVVHVLAALQSRSVTVLCVCPEAPQALMQRYNGTQVRVTREPVALPSALERADCVVNYGSAGMVCAALLAGKPQFMIPSDVEKTVVARKVAQQNAGRIILATGIGKAVDALWSDSSPGRAARQIAARYSGGVLDRLQQAFFKGWMGS